MNFARKSTVMILLGLSLLLGACSAFNSPAAPTQTPAPPTPTPAPAIEDSGWELVWADEFEGDTLNQENWLFDTGAGGWGNNEWQFYTERPENLRLEDGYLVIEAREEDYRGSDYTSARIKTQALQSWTYGRVEARLELPTGQGVWSAFWMLGEDFPTKGWPDCGEIDIMENIGESRMVYGTIHGPGYSGGNGIGSPFTVDGGPLSESFHTYAIEWSPGEISWYVDDALFNTITDTQVPGEWVYDHPFFIILNLAIGGEWPGYLDESTQFPQQYLVDYVRVYLDPKLSLEDLKGSVIHVADISVELAEVDEKWEGTVYVTVVDSNGNPVEGATIIAGWLDVVTGATKDAVTDQDGVAGPFVGQKISSSDEITFCISDVKKTSYDYDKDANITTCVFKSP